VSIVAVTDGEAAYTGVKKLGGVRRAEQQDAVTSLGVESEIVRLGFPDSAVTLHEEDLRDLLVPLLSRDTLVLAPWDQDCHPDHEACGRATQAACKESGTELVFYPIWSWHQKTVRDFNDVTLHRFELTPELTAAKASALDCHRSQLENESEEPILPERLLAPFRRSFETYLTYPK
jgi:LmbE family N-acetylglucosaminyl deacetylase